jgi:alginate O-acetyltransferase complex protein AlgI
MVFSSLTFIYLFLPLALFFHYLTPNKIFRNISLTAFSLAFYAWEEPMWIYLMIFTAIFDYYMALLIERWRGDKKAKVILLITILVNLSLLIFYKYGGFLYDNLSAIGQLPFDRPKNTLPVGISFYTFMVISYIVDVYRGQLKAQRNPLNFLMFISLFQHLVAGPIVRYSQIGSQVDSRTIDWSRFSTGISRFCLGLFKKIVIANVAGALVTKYLDAGFDDLSTIEAWFGITMFSVQLYFDFSGYSDMAIGLAKMFGFDFDENFRHPYAAQSVGDFYRRWHISLGKFFRDYVYIPMGGNRKLQLRNIMVVWLLTGIWHGASWNFALWGLYFGSFMIIEKLLENFLKKVPRFLRHTYTLILIIFSRAIFYFVDFTQLKTFVGNLFYSDNSISAGFKSDLFEHVFWFILVVLLCIPWDEIYPSETKVNKEVTRYYHILKPAFNIAMLFLATMLLVNSTYNPFLYTRF